MKGLLFDYEQEGGQQTAQEAPAQTSHEVHHPKPETSKSFDPEPSTPSRVTDVFFGSENRGSLFELVAVQNTFEDPPSLNDATPIEDFQLQELDISKRSFIASKEFVPLNISNTSDQEYSNKRKPKVPAYLSSFQIEEKSSSAALQEIPAKGLSCNFCGADISKIRGATKSAKRRNHEWTCPVKSKKELEKMPCPICQKLMSSSYIKVHLRKMHKTSELNTTM